MLDTFMILESLQVFRSQSNLDAPKLIFWFIRRVKPLSWTDIWCSISLNAPHSKRVHWADSQRKANGQSSDTVGRGHPHDAVAASTILQTPVTHNWKGSPLRLLKRINFVLRHNTSCRQEIVIKPTVPAYSHIRTDGAAIAIFLFLINMDPKLRMLLTEPDLPQPSHDFSVALRTRVTRLAQRWCIL